MLIESRKSDVALQDWIREYYYFSNTEESAKEIPVIDDCCYDWIFFKEAKSSLQHSPEQIELPISSHVFTIHALNPPFKFQLGTSMHFFTIKVQPWMNSYFFSNLPHKGIVDLGKEDQNLMNLHRKIFQVVSFEETFLLADEFLKSKDLIPNKNVSLIKSVCLFIYDKRGLISVNEISDRFQKPRQYIGKTFKSCVMYSLKKFIITVRILDLIQHKRNHPDISLTELCYQYEYFDQSHFIKDFKQVCGVTPTVFFDDIPKFLLRH